MFAAYLDRNAWYFFETHAQERAVLTKARRDGTVQTYGSTAIIEETMLWEAPEAQRSIDALFEQCDRFLDERPRILECTRIERSALPSRYACMSDAVVRHLQRHAEMPDFRASLRPAIAERKEQFERSMNLHLAQITAQLRNRGISVEQERLAAGQNWRFRPAERGFAADTVGHTFAAYIYGLAHAKLIHQRRISDSDIYDCDHVSYAVVPGILVSGDSDMKLLRRIEPQPCQLYNIPEFLERLQS